MRGTSCEAGSRPGRRAPDLLRRARLAAHLARGLAIAAFVFPFVSPAHRLVRVRRWSAHLLAILDVRVVVEGEVPPPGSAVLVVANHVSWIDIFALNAVRPLRFVGKREIRDWPVIGWLSERAGTLFIARGHRRAASRASARVAELLAEGHAFAVFPEGTTTPGDVLRPFHASLLQPAVIAGAPVQPVAIRYRRADGSLCREAAYDGDRTIGDTLRELAALGPVSVELCFCVPLRSTGRDRRALVREAETAIAGRLGLPVPDRAPGTYAGLPGAER